MFLVGETVRDGQKTMLNTFKNSQFWVGEAQGWAENNAEHIHEFLV